MALQTPNLDDRKFQDLVSEARSKIPLYCPKWTDYNLSDPGITLIELFSWMVDVLLYRLNRVPEKNYIKFMDLIGIQLEPPQPATANLTFRLSAPQEEPFVIPQGTEVSTVPTETQDAITFTTNEDFSIIVPDVAYAMTTPDDAAYDDIVSVAKAAQIHDFIGSLPDGYETVVGERGLTLSGGQRQRVTIARTLLTDPGILILDDSTSNVDAETEVLIRKAIDALLKGRTALIITQRASTCQAADKVVVMDKGRIAAVGSHSDLMASSPIYRQLIESQVLNIQEIDI